MSKRTVHCAREQFYWQSEHRFASEDSSYTRPELLSLRIRPGIARETGAGNYLTLPLNPKLYGRSLWWTFVRNYTHRKLTVASDHIAAFAGITHWYESKSGQTIVLGLNEEYFVHELAWGWDTPKNNSEFEPDRPASLEGMPTWMWLSQSRPVRPPIELQSQNPAPSDVVVLEEYKIVWKGETLTSPIVSSQLIITGIFAEVAFESLANQWNHVRESESHIDARKEWCRAILDDKAATADGAIIRKPCLRLTYSLRMKKGTF